VARQGRVRNLVRPQEAETVETSRSAGLSPAGFEARLLVGRSSRVAAGGFTGSEAPEPDKIEISHRPFLTTIPSDVEPADIQCRRSRSRRFTRFAAAGLLALVGGVASVPLITSHHGPTRPATTGNPAPAAPLTAIPAFDPGNNNDNSPGSNGATGAPAVSYKPGEVTAPAGTAAVPPPHTTRNDNQSTRQPKPPDAMMTPAPPRTPAIPAETDAWSRMAALNRGDQSRTRLRPEPPAHR
jgi:hypothetical protein